MRKAAGKIKKALAAIGVCCLSLFLALGTAAQGSVYVYADTTYTEYEKTAIEDDLKDVDTSLYPKDENGIHRLIDNGFVEYAYSTNAFIANNYFGIYFYVYNPTERELSEKAGAHVINMAVKYDNEGNPTDYENCTIRLLDETDNHRFLKFGLVNKQASYDRAREYARINNGERRYDVASVQLWFKGEQLPEDSFAGIDGTDGVSFTYRISGYCAGCGSDSSAEGTLDSKEEKLETISLNVIPTWYRTGAGTAGGYDRQNTLSSVYFSVPNRFIDEFGQLQIVKAKWYEYRTKPIFVTDNDKVYKALYSYLGMSLPQTDTGAYYDPNIPFECYHYNGPSDSGVQGLSYNYRKGKPQIQRNDWLIKTDNIEKTIPPKKVEAWANSYEIKENDEVLEIAEKRLNANLFEKEVEEGHQIGLNVREFDARRESDWINLKLENTTSSWDNFCNIFRLNHQVQKYLTAENVLPIEEISKEKLSGEDIIVSKNVLVDKTEVEDLKNYFSEADKADETVYILRFSVSTYESTSMEFHGSGDWTGTKYTRFYAAQDAVYLNFEIIHLGFVRGEDVTIIPVVMSPIDIYPALTPPPSMMQNRFWQVVYWLCGIAAACIVVIVVSAIVKLKTKPIRRN